MRKRENKMKTFLDKISTIGTHRVEAGVIVNSKGQQVGGVAIRYTKSNIGQNKEAGMSLSCVVKDGVNYSTTAKTDTYGEPLQEVMNLHGLTPTIGSGIAGDNIRDQSITGFLLGNEQFKILWAV